MIQVTERSSSCDFLSIIILQIGDIVHATYCVSQAFVFDTILGTNLCKLEDSLRHSIARIRELGQGEFTPFLNHCGCQLLIRLDLPDAMLLWITPVLQYVLNLQISNPMNWYDVVVLSGKCRINFCALTMFLPHHFIVVFCRRGYERR